MPGKMCNSTFFMRAGTFRYASSTSCGARALPCSCAAPPQLVHSMYQARQLVLQDVFGLARNPSDNFFGARDIVDEARILTHGQRPLIDVARFARGPQSGMSFGPVLAQRPLSPRPAFDELVPPR